MFSEFRALAVRSYSSIFIHAIAFVSVLVASLIGLVSGTIFVDTNVLDQFYAMLLINLAFVVAVSIFSLTGEKRMKLILSSILIILYAYLVIFSIPYYRITIFLLLALVLELWEFSGSFTFKSHDGAWLLSFAAALTSMVLISGLIRVQPPQNLGLLIASITDDVQRGGIPILFKGGMVFFTKYLVFSISVQALLMFAVLAFLLVENYFLIIGFFRRNSKSVIGGQVSGALTVLSCQCESITAAFPSIVSLVLSAAIIPLIGESIILVFLTNFLLRTRFIRGFRVGFLERVYPLGDDRKLLALSSILVVALPVIETVGVYFGWQRILYFFGGVNFLMFISGILLALIIRRAGLPGKKFHGRLLPSILIALSSIAMFAWFYPPLTSLSVSSGGYFGMMSISSLAGGIISGLVYLGLSTAGKRLFLEFLGMMFTMFSIVVFYISVLTAYSIWTPFGLTEQVIFSIAVWIISLPYMWLTTNIALNYSVPKAGAA